MLTMEQYTPLIFLRMFLNAALLSTGVYISSVLVSKAKPCFRHYLYTVLANIAVIVINYMVLGRESPYTIVPSVLAVFFIVWLSYRHFSWRYWRDSFIVFGLYMLCDMVCGMLLMNLFEPDVITEMRYFTSALCYVPDAVVALVFVGLSGVYGILRRHLSGRSVNFYLLRVIRPAIMLLTIVLLYVRNMQRIAALDELARYHELTIEFSIMVIIALLGASYIVQDLIFTVQRRCNQTLEQQHETQNILLQETRTFRHNIANMLYGLQGVILSGNYNSIWEYYNKTAEKCAVINNENIIALRRIPSMAVHTLLMQKIQAANDENIPFYVFTDENLSWNNAKDGVICEILGVLIDNAIEATRDTEARYVSVEAHQIPHGIELAVRNTWKQEQTDFLKGDEYQSHKSGHEGLGLRSVRKLVQKDRHMIFNIYRSGRYIEANVQVMR